MGDRDPTANLPDDLLVEIVSRMPYKSTCCCKCVSTRWRDLISHPDHRKKLPRSTLAGFFYSTYDIDRNPCHSHDYESVSGNWRSFDAFLLFLPEWENLEILDCCNGLLLCRYQMLVEPKADYVVCNPATEKWVTVPASEWSSKVEDVRLGFDPAVSSHFHVFELVPAMALDVNKEYDNSIQEVGIYSSEAGDWTHQIEWDYPFVIGNFSGSAFLSGVLYLPSGQDSVAAIDVDGNCRIIPIPIPTSHDGGPDVCVSRGQLYLTIQGASELSIWVLTDSSSENCWTLKLNGSYLELFGIEYSSSKHRVISAHPEHDVIFVAVESESGYLSLVKLCSYEMDSGELRVICDLGWNSRCPYLPYVPLFSESLADGH